MKRCVLVSFLAAVFIAPGSLVMSADGHAGPATSDGSAGSPIRGEGEKPGAGDFTIKSSGGDLSVSLDAPVRMTYRDAERETRVVAASTSATFFASARPALVAGH